MKFYILNQRAPKWKIPKLNISLFQNEISHMDTESFFIFLFFYCRDYDWSDDESETYFNNMHQHDEYSHSEIMNQCNFGSEHLINARLSSQTCLQHQADSSTQNAIQQCLNSNDFESDHGTEETIKTFPTMLKLVGGTLVGSEKYADLVYIDSDEEKVTSSTNSYKDLGTKKKQRQIPSLPQIAQKVARLEKTQLDKKQYIAYEMIACTFSLGLVNDGSDKNTKLGAYLQQTMEIANTTTDAKDVIKKLKARGGREQLLIFLTGPAGSGKSTFMKVAQQ